MIERRLQVLAAILLTLAAHGCGSSTPFDGQTPVITGAITSRAPLEGMPAMLVVADGASNGDCYPRIALFELGPDVMVFHKGSQRDTSELAVGVRVSVFAPTPVVKPCLPISNAEGVFIE